MLKTSLLVAVLLLLVSAVFAAGPSGRQVMEEQKKRHQVASQYSEELMVLVDKKNNRERRELRRYLKEMPNDLHKGLMVFDKPPGIRGTALLTWEQDKRDNDLGYICRRSAKCSASPRAASRPTLWEPISLSKIWNPKISPILTTKYSRKKALTEKNAG